MALRVALFQSFAYIQVAHFNMGLCERFQVISGGMCFYEVNLSMNK